MTLLEQPKPSGYSLATLRMAIDTHDEAILNALTARQRLVDRIGDIKNKDGEQLYRPAREAQILRKLLRQADASLDKTLVYQLWREIFSSTVSRQQPLRIAVVENENISLTAITRQHFGHVAKLQTQNLADALLQLINHKTALAVVPASAAAEIIGTINLDPQIQINGILPFLSAGAPPQAYVMGRCMVEETGDDITLIKHDFQIELLDGFKPDHPACIGIAPRPFALSAN